MAQRKSKILDTDLQLYLTDELGGEKLVRVSEIDATPMSELKLASDRRAKGVLGKLREVDQMFESAAEESFPMPAAFEKQINEILAAKTRSQKKNTTTILDKIKAYFTGPNVWSLAGGGAAAAFAMLLVIQINPALLISQTTLKRDAVFRAVDKTKVGDSPCGLIQGGDWIVTDEFLVQIPICSSSGDNTSLTIDGEVNVGDRFSIFVMPIKSNFLSIDYEDQDGNKTSLVTKADLRKGSIFSLPNVGAFVGPQGREKFNFVTKDGFEFSVKLVISE